MKLKMLATAAAAAIVLCCGSAQAANQLIDPGFDTPSGLGPTSFGGTGDGGLSEAAAWRMWNNIAGPATTDGVPSTDPFGGGQALHVTTAGGEDGVYQFVAPNTVSLVRVDVFLLSGTFELGLGQGGFYAATAKTSVLGQWVRLHAHYPPLPLAGSPDPNQVGDEIFLYSTAGSGAEFYVDNAYAGPALVPEPATWAMLLIGLGGIGALARRGTRRVRAA